MLKALIGRKIGMTQIFEEDGTNIPVTVIEAGPCFVVQKRTMETDGYKAVQLGFGEKRERLFNKPLKGHFTKAKVKPLRYLKEFKLENADDIEVGQEIKVDVFNPGDKIDVTGISKGKGFAGGIKRHGFHRGPMSHGSKYHRGSGSLGAMEPARVFKGRKLPGHMGSEKVTVQNLEIIKVDPEKNILAVKGAVPGIRGSVLYIKDTVKSAK